MMDYYAYAFIFITHLLTLFFGFFLGVYKTEPPKAKQLVTEVENTIEAVKEKSSIFKPKSQKQKEKIRTGVKDAEDEMMRSIRELEIDKL